MGFDILLAIISSLLIHPLRTLLIAHTDMASLLLSSLPCPALQISKFGFIYALILSVQKRCPTATRSELVLRLGAIFSSVIAAPEKHLSQQFSKALKLISRNPPAPTVIDTFHGGSKVQVGTTRALHVRLLLFCHHYRSWLFSVVAITVVYGIKSFSCFCFPFLFLSDDAAGHDAVIVYTEKRQLRCSAYTVHRIRRQRRKNGIIRK
jgi:hypothetical protein